MHMCIILVIILLILILVVQPLRSAQVNQQYSALVSAANALKNQYLSAFNELYLALDCVQLALVQKQTVQIYAYLDDFIKNTLKRERDVILHKKENYTTKGRYFITTMKLVHLKSS